MRTTLWIALSLVATCACSSSEKTNDPDAGLSGSASGGSNNGGRGGAQTSAGGGSGAGGGAAGKAAAAGSSADEGGAGDGGSAGSSGGGSGGSAQLMPTVADFVGVNAFIDDPIEKLAAVGNVREYHNWSWNDGNGAADYPAYPNNQLSFSLFDGFWDFDDYYAQLHAADSLVFPCILGSVKYLNDAMPPVASGASDTLPASYVAHASLLFQYAARYGATKVDDAKLKLAPGQVVTSGLGLLRYYEDGNEPDANWVKSDASALFSPAATAAMVSADYDGHQGALGAGFGVKTADPDAKLVLPGLAGAGASPTDWVANVTTYLDGMRAWVDTNRGGAFPADVINVHEYCFGAGAFGDADPPPGLSPEDCKLAELLGRIAGYRDQHLPGKEVWLTEFGYDTHPHSRLRAPELGGNSAEMVQAQWIVRSFLELLASGIDRAFLYTSRDNCTGDDAACPDNAVQFSTAGILTQKGDEKAKPAWYFLSAFRKRLGAMRYAGIVEASDPQVRIAKFYDSANSVGAYVVWSSTSEARVVQAFALEVKPKSATLVTLTGDSETGVESALSANGGHVSLSVSETPSIVLVEGEP